MRLKLPKIPLDEEYNLIVEALKKTNFNKGKAAELLGINRRTLYEKLKKHNATQAEKHEAA